MELVIVTGLSGAGKSTVYEALEDIGYYCVDNVPSMLISSFVGLILNSVEVPQKVAIVSDMRSENLSDNMLHAIKSLKESSVKFKLVFMDASSDVLQRRFKETRRKHPLIGEADGILPRAIELEKKHTAPIKFQADFIVDTSDLSVIALKDRIKKVFSSDEKDRISVICMSFGSKYGGVDYADLMFDVRCLPNPFYIDNLKSKTGIEDEVRSYVLGQPVAVELRDKLFELLDMLMPLYANEGKSQLVIAFSCTGGKHRSVVFAEEIGKHIAQNGYPVTIEHRDIKK